MNKLHITLILLVIGTLLITACGNASTPTPTPEPTVSPAFKGNITIKYVYDGVPETWLSQLPETRTVEVTYNNEDGWSNVDSKLMSYANVTMFSLEVDPPNDDDETKFGGCQWNYSGSGWDDDSLVYVNDYFSDCTSVEPNTIIPVDVTMAYCAKESGDSLLCHKQGLTMFVAENYVSFSANEEFLPQYREWIREVIELSGNAELPDVLQPNYNYIISTQ